MRPTGPPKAVAIPLLAVALLGTVGLADARRSARSAPNLTVAKVSDPPVSSTEGARFSVSETVVNAGPAAAGKSETRFYLTLDPKRSLDERGRSRTNPRAAVADVLLLGSRRVPKLRAHARSATPKRPKLLVTVPIGTASGNYHLLACADDRGVVPERVEHDNCRASKRQVRVEGGNPEPLRIDAFSDTLEQPEVEEDLTSLSMMRPALCQPPPKRAVPTLPRAIASARLFLKRVAGADAMRAFARSPEYRDADRAQAAAGAAVVSGQPGAALAALLRAHELEPKEASHLLNASALATSVGLPAEGLAMNEAAAGLDDPDAPAMGLSRQAVALAGRGSALVGLGRWAEAETALKAALSSEPLLSEAATSLSTATLCSRGAEAAVPFLRRGRKRQEERDPPVDEEQGEVTALRRLPLAATTRNAESMRSFYQGQQQEIGFEGQRLITRRSALEERGAEKRDDSLSSRRRDELLGLVYGVREPEEDFRNAIDRANQHFFVMWGPGGQYQQFSNQADAECASASDYDACFTNSMRTRCTPATRSEHAAFLNSMTLAVEIAQSRLAKESRRMSGIAANIKDPDTHALALLEIEQRELGFYTSLFQPAQAWTSRVADHAHHCVESPEGQAAATPEPASAASKGPCPPGLKALNAVVDFAVLKVKANCEEIALEFSGKGWLSAFAEVRYNVRGGEMTVVAGPKASLQLPPVTGGPTLKAEFKSGIYVTVTNDGIKDVGARVGPSATVGAGPIEYGFKDQVNLSFLPASPPNPGGLGDF